MTEKILVFVPAYNCRNQIIRVLDQVEAAWVKRTVTQVIVVNNRSTDDTADRVAERIRIRGDDYVKLLLNDANYGLGGSHKVAFQYAILHGFDWIVVLHGDDQGRIADFREQIEGPRPVGIDGFMGSRFMTGSQSPGYSTFRIFGNHVFNAIYSACLGHPIRDRGAGLNIYRVSSLRFSEIVRFPDDLTFNCVMLCSQIIGGDKLQFLPISWREEDQVSNVKLISQSLQTLGIALSALTKKTRFIAGEHRSKSIDGYTWKVVDV